MSKLSHSNPAFQDVGVVCIRCTCWVDSAACSAKASDLCNGEPVCEDCAPEVIEENGQFGLGA
jgi:hypothetical protein